MLRYFQHETSHAFLALGSIFLVVTGGEALYADMGHFGIKPIRLGWYLLVGPALILNYFGQGAALLTHQDAGGAMKEFNPFYALVPQPLIIPMVVLATLATIIASVRASRAACQSRSRRPSDRMRSMR